MEGFTPIDQEAVQAALSKLPLGPIHYFDTVTSTNDLARDWAEGGAPDLALIVADEQTAGKGRLGRSWLTPRGAALAFSLVLRPRPGEDAGEGLARLGGAAGLGVASAIRTYTGVKPELKWPNDVLLKGKKVCGILTEADWIGPRLRSVVLGIGINVLQGSVPPEDRLQFPATSLEAAAGQKPDRLHLLTEVLAAFLRWRDKPSAELISEWEANLAFKDIAVRVHPTPGEPYEGHIAGLDPQGRLLLKLDTGQVLHLPSGDISLRPVDSPPE
jgi:BirA family transcriptional regulator, biotin operon repressor / biotin---[acetyl-CoA-carboxylase] ligase